MHDRHVRALRVIIALAHEQPPAAASGKVEVDLAIALRDRAGRHQACRMGQAQGASQGREQRAGHERDPGLAMPVPAQGDGLPARQA
ncbi:hypothetical protein [Herbaspirillum aquaticum]|uniref:hypothetical protein n=1 Tax=Herbaspirillum aquaticum TaxID=568783 RepID=UPI0024DDFD35|nr:hypothetical protein [Herbaspirillum aquaticum]